MKIAGFNFTKISVEKFSDNLKNLKINTNLDISEINEFKSDLFKTKEEIIEVNFDFKINYDPDFAKINIKGNVLLAFESKKVKDIIKQWKNKKIPEDIKITLFNIILRKSNLKALQLEEELNLPFHISFPSLKKE
ncbi:MAG: hypothetical protein KKF68_01260 [Nanoarchaeota archaeon]|nr:hypothetical protein [Nanoarchaeota archaeon]